MPYVPKKKEDKKKTGTPSKLESEQYLKAQDEIAELLHKGWLVNEIYAEMLVDIPDLTELLFNKMVKAAYDKVKTTIHRNREYIFKLHMDRYETIYKKNTEMVDSWNVPLDPKKDWHIIVAKHSSALKALKAKEDLLGLHNKDVVIDITENDAVMHAKPEMRGRIPFDLEQLTFDEKVELIGLLKEAKVSEDDGVRKLIVKKTPLQLVVEDPNRPSPSLIETIDVIYEEMPAKIVDKLQVVDISEPPVPPDPNFIDARTTQQIEAKSITIDEARKQLHKATIEKFKEKLKAKK